MLETSDRVVAQKGDTAELKIRCSDPDALRIFIERAVAERLGSLSDGIRQTENRLQEFEVKYRQSTEEFLRRFNNDELQHTFDFDEWIGESRMLKRLRAKAERLRGIEFVD